MDFPMAELRSWKEPIDQPHHVNPHSDYCYPGGHATFTNSVYLSLYEEEESREQPVWGEPYAAVDPCSGLTNKEMSEGANRPTIYYLLRLFDSIRGFHKGSLDLSGRHPERYYNLQSQWNRYLCSFLSLETEIRPCGDHGGISQYQIAFNAERWHRFQLKWRLPESASYSQLLKCTQKVLQELKQHPAPCFQIIRLIDLPVEVLDNIVSLASTSQAKALACTCHTLNDIGQRHIFRTWPMRLHVPAHISPFNVEYSSIDLPTLAYYARQDLERSARFLIDTPHISQRVQRLVLTDEWCVARRAQHDQHTNPFALPPDFYKGVTQIWGSALQIAPRLSTLVLCNLELGTELLRRISEIRTLHTLEMHLCAVPRSALRKLLVAATSASANSTSSDNAANNASSSSILCPQISNLRIYMDSSFAETHSQWAGLLLCPAVRTLSVVQFGIGAFPAPPDAAFWTRCRLDHLERLSLDNIDAGDLSELVRFLSTPTNNGASVPGAAHRMTHFKLHMDWGLPDADVLALLSALHTAHAPLEILVLEGLAEASFALFDGIASLFPDLRALTLVRRENGSQHQNKRALWPGSSWEYAQRLRAFRRLEAFCWNFKVEYWDATPRALLGFETDFGAAGTGVAGLNASGRRRAGRGVMRRVESDSTGGASAAATEDVPYFLDSHWMALPFVAYCPTLRSFSLMDRTVDMVCRINSAPVHTSGSGCRTSTTENIKGGYLGNRGSRVMQGTNGSGRTGTAVAKVLTPTYYPMHSGAFSWTTGGDLGSGAGGGGSHECVWNTTASHWPTLAPLASYGSGDGARGTTSSTSTLTSTSNLGLGSTSTSAGVVAADGVDGPGRM
ncbi:hypothetical protein JR316_0013173 [Psilocybe cubensis]|uniref:F-box domain-containing protein n=2 Tax=Psilocybe cubensis TaxID=181762 RepID=A0A8H7XRQ2_PSICU|nr:hypothetical protein JR316_0013173 [Psilocybe cubensis]KAH9474708.1 hypothetical protein JR316_0013173 [Psilocybe cubensis]